jgi:hypothetical protein
MKSTYFKPYFTICCVVLLFGNLAQAQHHVFMNKKNIIKYEFGIWDAFLFGVKGTPMPTIKNGICIERMVSNSTSLNLLYSRMDMRDNEFVTHDIYSLQNGLSPSDLIKGKYSSNTVELILKKYGQRRSLYSPMGNYFLIGAFYKYETINANAVTYDVGDYSGEGFLNTYKAKIHDGGFTMGIGNNTIIRNNLALGFEFKISLPFKAINDYVANNAYGFSSNITLERQDIKALTNRRVLYNLFSLKINFGVLY